MRKCVGFVGYESDQGFRLGGTAFVISVLMPGRTDVFLPYFWTAAHVIHSIRKHSVDGKTYVRMNKPGGGLVNIVNEIDEWTVHPDQAADVAFILAHVPQGEVEYKAIPLASFATEEALSKVNVGPGDEVFMTGLFVQHSGAGRNIPIVRAGIIAAMPEEPVSTKLGLTPAYLVEARSIGGLSGSPAFMYYGSMRVNPETGEYQALRLFQWLFLGVVHGHWQTTPGPYDPIGLGAEPVNMGIAIVIPATRLLDLIDSPAERQRRDEYAAQYTEQENEHRQDLR